MNDLPAGWEVADLRDVTTDISYGFTTSSALHGNGPKLLRITDIQEGNVDWLSVPHCVDTPRPSFLLQAGDIVIARTGATTGKSFLIEKLECPTVFASYLIRARFAAAVEPKYAWAYMRSKDYWSQIQIVSKGTAQPGANAQLLSELRFPIAPVPEQRRIMAKLDSLSGKSKRARDQMDHIPRLVEKYKQAILAAAFRGDLTGDDVRQSTLRLADIATLRTGPFGSSLHKDDYIENGIPLVNPMHIIDGRIAVSSHVSVSKKRAEDLRDFRMRRGDVVLARRGVMGRCAVVSPDQEGFICGTGSMIVRPMEKIDPGYLQRYLSSPDTIRALEAAAVGTTMVNINQSILLGLEIFLPSLDEQKKVLHRIDSAFGWIDRLASEATSARKLINHLDHAVLAKAFRGELVPQNPNDEPASILLERIRAERAAVTGTAPRMATKGPKRRRGLGHAT